MEDSLLRIIENSGNFFAIACITTNCVEEACRRHDVGPTAAVGLGRALTGATLLAALLKDGQAVQLKFEGSGPLAKIIAEAGYDGWMRGYVAHPQAEVPLRDGRIDIASGIGRAGFLTVSKDIGLGKKYQGMVQLYTSEIAEDIAYYLDESEQKPSVVALATYLEPDGRIAAAGGFLVQALPQANEETLTALEMATRNMPPLSSSIRAGADPLSLLEPLLKGFNRHQTGTKTLNYQCSCSVEKMQAALLSLGPDQLRAMMEQHEDTEVLCEFCRYTYHFSSDDFRRLLGESSRYSLKKD